MRLLAVHWEYGCVGAPRGPIDMPDGDGAGWWSIDLDTFEFDLSQLMPSPSGMMIDARDWLAGVL